MRWRQWILIVSSAFAAWGAAGEAAARVEEGALGYTDGARVVGRLADLQGTVWVHDPDADEWTAAPRNRPLAEGARVWVDEGGRADLRIGATRLLLAGGSELALTRLDAELVELTLLRGAMALGSPSERQASRTAVLTSEGRFQLLQAGAYRFDREHDDSIAGVRQGALMFSGNGNLLHIEAGQRFRVGLDHRGRYALTEPEGWPSDRLAAWAAAALEGGPTTSAYLHVDPDMTGAEELDRHGRWDSHPDHGTVWIPHRLAPGWAPFEQGRWAWVQPWGWTWIDAAPWGFATSHYGRWLQWRGRWCWWPGVRTHRPAFSPAVVAWVGGPNLSLSFSIGGPPRGSWVPLRPHQRYVPIVAPHRHRHPRQDPPRSPRPIAHPSVRYGSKGVPEGVRTVPPDALVIRSDGRHERPADRDHAGRHDRQPDRQHDTRRRDRPQDTRSDRHVDRQPERQADGRSDGSDDRRSDRQVDRQADRQAERRPDRQNDRQNDRRFDRQPDRPQAPHRGPAPAVAELRQRDAEAPRFVASDERRDGGSASRERARRAEQIR